MNIAKQHEKGLEEQRPLENFLIKIPPKGHNCAPGAGAGEGGPSSGHHLGQRKPTVQPGWSMFVLVVVSHLSLGDESSICEQP